MQDYQKIDLNDYVQTGEGGTAVSYTHKNGNALIKLYHAGFEADRAIEDFHTAKLVFEMGIPTPEPKCLVTDGQRYGAEYELIKNKRSFARIISQEPERLEELTLEFARMTRDIHSTKADTTKLRSYRQMLISFYQEAKLLLPSFNELALSFLDKVPDTPLCLHGDLHIGNIISDGKRTLWIDTGDFSYGVPELDLAMMYTMCFGIREEFCQNLFHVSSDVMHAHWNLFLPAYCGTNDKQKLNEFVKHLLPFYAVKVPYMYNMAFHASLPKDGLEQLVNLIR